MSVLGLSVGGWAQTHKVEKPEAVVRAVGVYEWTGELAKPVASRLIPVSLYIHGELEDAAVYQPQPIPFALLPGNAYELQQAGIRKGLVEIASAGKLDASTSGFDNVWIGYGTFRPEPTAKESKAKLRVSKDISPITTGKENPADAPVKKSGADGANKVDPDRPTLRRRGAAGKGDTDKQASGAGGAADPTPAGTPADDPDRPVLKKRGAGTGTAGVDRGVTVDTQSLNSDPDRPNLHRGKPTGGTTPGKSLGKSSETAMAALVELPKELHQMVAVSDAATRAEHDFVRPWADEAEHKAVLGTMEKAALERLAGYGAANRGMAGTGALPAGAGALPTGAKTVNSGATRSTAAATTPAALRRAAALAAAKRKAAAAPVGGGLLEEELKSFTLSYGGAPTYVYTAHTAGTSDALRYVTVVGQQDTFGAVQTAFASVTDAAHLDRTPWMRLVGVVDAEASNRASLLFEMREGRGRQFALYQVLGARSEAMFTTGTTQ